MPQDSGVRSKSSFGKALLWAGLVAVLLFAPFDWNGCGFFRRGATELVHFGFTFAWFVIFFALRLKWRFLLLVVTLPVLLYFFGLRGVPEENAGPEAAVVGGLRQIQAGVETYRREHQQQHPESLASMPISAFAQKFYTYEYVPRRDATGRIVGYLVRATPKRRDCDFPSSFAIADDGKVFYTLEPRAAATTDKILE
jgi:hypothetical protein